MQKDEDYLLRPWLAYHGHLFGIDNLHVLDNGSTDPAVQEILAEFEYRGAHVYRTFSTKEDFVRKGEIMGNVIRNLDATDTFDFLLPFDCDEFLILRTPWGYTCQKESILAYLMTLRGENRALRIPYQLANNPYEDDFYTYFAFIKAFFARGSFDFMDHGHHSGQTKGNPGCRDVDLVHIHFHYPPYARLASRARQKWISPVKPENALIDATYEGESFHLIPHFSMQEGEYWVTCMHGVQFYVPAFRDLLQRLGAPLSLPRDVTTEAAYCGRFWPVVETLIGRGDKVDLGPSSRTAMFVPPGAESVQWTKVYLNEADYLSKHPDVRAAPDLTAIRHFCQYGHREAARIRSIWADDCDFTSLGEPDLAPIMGGPVR